MRFVRYSYGDVRHSRGDVHYSHGGGRYSHGGIRYSYSHVRYQCGIVCNAYGSSPLLLRFLYITCTAVVSGDCPFVVRLLDGYCPFVIRYSAPDNFPPANFSSFGRHVTCAVVFSGIRFIRLKVLCMLKTFHRTERTSTRHTCSGQVKDMKRTQTKTNEN